MALVSIHFYYALECEYKGVCSEKNCIIKSTCGADDLLRYQI